MAMLNVYTVVDAVILAKESGNQIQNDFYNGSSNNNIFSSSDTLSRGRRWGSVLGVVWMMEHGLLSPDRAKRAYDRKLKRQQQIRTGTPNKSSPKLERPQSSQKQQVTKNGSSNVKRKIMNGSDDEGVFPVKRTKVKA
ncbi:hypothetical protein GIB67_025314 [Kingdonia uniflora]|uniref:Uncharacterized protein n=1 Tax=Kingdonia uniflora TaxID=39325 RepID=A0A7J7NCA8_9MAGN|nr:hypothetical protein GIB67_025314 [Kingdonia uniflora]